jgi:hypothetical protein
VHDAKKSESPNNEDKAEDIIPKLEAGGAGGNGDATSSEFFAPPVSFQGPIEKDFGTLVISEEGRSRYVNHNFWARVTEEVAVPLLYDASKMLNQA